MRVIRPGQLLRSPVGRWLVAALIILAPFAPAATADAQSGQTTADAQSGQKRVLVLYSTRRDGQFSILGERELPRMLDSGSSRSLDYYAEFLDLARSPAASYRTAFSDFLRQKYPRVRFDVVIAMHDPAVRFVDEYGDALFPDTPLVFLTNTPVRTPRPNSTGVIQQRNFAATVSFIRQLQPDVRQVFIITGAAATDREYEDTVRRQLQPLAGSGLTFNYLSGLAVADLEARLSQMPEHSAVYYVIVSSDPADVRPHPLNYVGRVAAVANAPTYSWVDSTIGHGVVGGSVYSQRGAIERVGQLALRVLGGESADSIPAVNIDRNSLEVDWRQLQRWRIDETRVPAGTIIRFRDPSLWDEYPHYIVAALVLFAIQTALIAGLLIQRRRRQRAEGRLLQSQNALIGTHSRNRDLAARLLQAQEAERSRIARELHDDICQRMLLLTIELESVARSHDDDRAAAAALTLARDVSSSVRELSHQLHPTRLQLIGLVNALESLCRELSHAGVAVLYTHESVPSALPPDVMLCLFRVAQEALQNALKYSAATQIAVHIGARPDGLTLAISDNGVGFDVDAAWGKGVGLGSMSERLQGIGGSLELTSRPGAGTGLVATVPGDFLQSAPHGQQDATRDPSQ
jgi:signal transduction histidine kinase